MVGLDKIYAASKMLFDNMPFYGILSLRVRKVVDDSIPTACIRLGSDNYSIEIAFGSTFLEKLTLEETRGVLEHELLHLINGHISEPIYNGNHINHALMNVAMDAEINQYINRKLLPKEGVFLEDMNKEIGLKLPEKAGTMTYYDLLVRENAKDTNGKIVSVHGHELSPMDDHALPQPTTQAAAQAAAEMVIEQAAQETLKRRGTVPGNVISMLDQLKEKRKPVIDWKQFLRRFVSNSYEEYTITTRRRESRRFDEAPGLRHEPEFSLLVAIDTSGSVSESDFKEFMGEMDNIYKNKVQIKVLTCDTRMFGPYDYKSWAKKPKFEGRGGTSFSPILEYYNQSKETCLVYFTDGYCSVDTKFRKPVLWLICSTGTTEYVKDYKHIKMTKK